MTKEETLPTGEITAAVLAVLDVLQASQRQGRTVAISLLAAMASQEPCPRARVAMRNDMVRDLDLGIAQFPSGGAT